ncbi:MAG: hypothetical protein P4L91_14430 [Burkholderiaceae bacterium]|nr:hypothetical protein [Burkholderiaceae bacterium]
MQLRKLLIAIGLAGFASAALADAPAVANPAAIDEVKQILHLAEVDKLAVFNFHRHIEQGNLQHPELAVDTDLYLSFLTEEAIDDHLAPIFAKYLSQNYADKLLAALQTPIGRTSTRIELMQFESGEAAARAAWAKLSPGDQRAFNEFRRSAPYLSFVNAQNLGGSEIRTEFDTWTTEVMAARGALARKQLASLFEEEIKSESQDADGSGPALADRITRTGMRSFDQEMRLSVQMIRNTARLSQRIVREDQQLNLQSVLKPENLVTREGIEAGNLTVLTAQNLFAEHRKANEAITAEYERGIDNIPMTAENRQKLKDGNSRQLAELLDIQLRDAERTQNVLELEKQILALCESQLGKTTLQDGIIMFPAGGTAQAYNTLIAKVRAEADEADKIEKEDTERRLRIVESIKKQ